MFERLRDRLTKRGRTDGYGGEGPDVPVTVDGMPDDPFFVALTQELGALGAVEVPAAARERTWALMREELERRPASASVRWSPRREGAGARRWALGSVALVAASALAVVVAFAGFGGDDGDQMAGTGTQTTQVEALPGDTTPDPDVTTPDTGTSVDPGVDEPGTGTTGTPTGTDTPTVSTTPPTTGAPASTLPPTTRPPTTTEPSQTTTTGRSVMTREQRESSAEGAARFVAQQVIAGDPLGAGSALAGQALRDVVQLAGALENPSGYSGKVLYTNESGGRVEVVFTDLVDDGQGGVTETARSFFMDVQFDDEGRAVVVRISAAPGS